MTKPEKSFEPTKAQKNAIDAEGGAVIVSAAAGSGKTKVLVQRVIRLLTQENPVPADKLLMMTFTKAAAAEMKTRISREIDLMIDADPGNELLRRQQLLLAGTDICTIHSFCGNIVRENFYRLNINRDFRIDGASESEKISLSIISAMIEEYYREPERSRYEDEENYQTDIKKYRTFGLLSMLLTGTKLDSELDKELLQAYRKFISHAFPEDWMELCVRQYDPSISIDDSDCAGYLLSCIKPLAVSIRTKLEAASALNGAIRNEASSYGKSKLPARYKTYFEAFEAYSSFTEKLEQTLGREKISYTEVCKTVKGFNKLRITLRKDYSQELSQAYSALIGIADIVTDEIMPMTAFSAEQYNNACKKLHPVLCLLRDFLNEFDRRFFEAKREKNILDFNDLERLMLRLLYESNGRGGRRRTEFADDMSERYSVIMVDEYQDTNDVQENIFKAISRDGENLFVVGDVKQSIYRFREAEPSIFRERCRSSVRYKEGSGSFPAMIVLDSNFRSRKGVIDSVNYIFGLLMSEESGEIEYNEDQRLTYGASYSETDDPETELHLLEYGSVNDDDSGDDEGSDTVREQAEGAYCAKLIKEMISGGMTVTEDGEERPAEYSDFCILMRAVSTHAEVYAAELHKAGIPAYIAGEIDLLKCYEVRAAVSYLKILSNPLSDPDFIAALLCPVAGFTPDELVKLRLVHNKRRSYYKRLRNCAADDKNGELSEKCRNFFKLYDEFRLMAATMPSDRLLASFFERTGFIEIMRTMPGGEQRVQNLRRLQNYVSSFESSTNSGLTGLVRHLNYLEETGKGISVKDSSSSSAVKIMTIHHSKGLEFPVCILAGTGGKTPPDKNKVKYHTKLGIGLRDVDTDKLIRYKTMQLQSIETAASKEEKSEQLRVLYVALTRAKERLILLTPLKVAGNEEERSASVRDQLNKLAQRIEFDSTGKRLSGRTVRKCYNYAQWLLMCALLNGSMTELRELAGVSEQKGDGESIALPSMNCGSRWKFVHAVSGCGQESDLKSAEAEIPADPELLEYLKNRFSEEEEIPFSSLPSKVSASMLAHQGSAMEFVAVSKPGFARVGQVSPTEMGTATHQFLQYADFSKLADSSDEERRRIISEGYMTEEQISLVSEESIRAFTGSSIFRKALDSLCCRKEYQFTVLIPGEMISQDNTSEAGPEYQSVLQGAIDLLIEEEDGLIVVDYKTDRVKDVSKLGELYSRQLRLYSFAAEKLFGKKVKACCIYSLYRGEELYI